MRKIGFSFSSLKETRFHEYVARFFFGGVCTALAGIIARRYGPVLGGLFLAFPAIFPASATMIENNEKRRKQEIGADGTQRGRIAASIDASGASLGCFGLAAFGLVLWQFIPQHNALATVMLAFASWTVVSYLLWAFRKG
ncbi:DUF3147 family protein [Granulicella cerasi]|uniref:DUF3147 family protein n=1 Tax=Granulicella cerasi TaxID=741063 RepID=A0ABW1ZDV8_9BACT|nr:DUF3147 family protein [Granulicella cerasi]